MKNTKLFFATLVSMLVPFAAHAVSPSEVNVTVYQLWASTSTDCTSPIKVIDNGTAGKTSNIVTGPDLGEGTLPPDGTYKCLIAVIADNVQVVPSANGTISGQTSCNKDTGTVAQALACNDNACVSGTAVNQKTCNNGTTQADALPDGTAAACDGSGGKVAVFFSTTGNSSADGHKASTAKKMDNAVVVAGASTNVTFEIYDPVGLKSEQNGTGCGQTQHASLTIR